LLIGLLLFLRASFELLSKKWQIVEESQNQSNSNIKELLTLSLATGIVPCPGAVIILTFALTIGIIIQGYLAMLAIAIGMGLTTSFFALIALGTRSTLLKLSQKKIKLFSCLYYILSFTGAFFILAFGAIMLIGSWQS
ncbi:MAG: sulfite exporter TauE/SafE family protein, partial [Thermodesulfobacteriota bacterium]